MHTDERTAALAAAPHTPATEADTDAFFALVVACDGAYDPDEAQACEMGRQLDAAALEAEADEAAWLDRFVAESDAAEAGYRALIDATNALLASPLPVRR